LSGAIQAVQPPSDDTSSPEDAHLGAVGGPKSPSVDVNPHILSGMASPIDDDYGDQQRYLTQAQWTDSRLNSLVVDADEGDTTSIREHKTRRKRRKRSDKDGEVRGDEASLSSSADSFGSLLEHKRLFSVVESTAFEPRTTTGMIIV
jgi:hypothetical protein